MSYTFSDQQAKLDSLLGDSEEDTDSQFPTSVRKKEINRGELNFARDTLCLLENQSGTVSNKEISLPSEWLETFVLIVDNVVITNDREISLTQWERYQDWNGDRPFYYFWAFAGIKKIKFFGDVNGKSYQLFFFEKPTTELSSDSDTSPFDEEYREASVYFAAGNLMLQIGKTDLANTFFSHRDPGGLLLPSYRYYVEKAKVDCEKRYVNLELARPDFGEQFIPENDVQGQGLGISQW